MALTPLQEKFINEYLIDFNATRAAERAGYDGNDVTLASVGYENLRKPQIAEVISKRLTEAAMGAEEVLMRLAEQARAEQSRYLTARGVDMESLIRDGKGHLVKSIKHTQYGDNIEFHDAQAALVHIGRHHKLFTDVTENKTEIEIADATDPRERIASRIASIADRKRAEGGTERPDAGGGESS